MEALLQDSIELTFGRHVSDKSEIALRALLAVTKI
jgi:hypothetical protein